MGDDHAHRDKIQAHPRDQEGTPPVNDKGVKYHSVDDKDDALVHLARSCAIEFFGTFYLCLGVAFAAGQGAPLAAISIGVTLMVGIYAGGHISGANYNPAVSFAIFLRGKLSGISMIAYICAQLCGGFAAGGIVHAYAEDLDWDMGYPVPNAALSDTSALLVEFMYTFMLCIVVLHTATTKAQSGNSFFGLAIGLTVTSAAISVGGLSGGAFNPAVGTCLPVVAGDSDHIWIYWLGPMMGGAGAALFFALTADADEFDELERGSTPLDAIASLQIPHVYKCFLVEFTGTMFLCAAVGAIPFSGSLAAISIGGALMVMIYMGGHVSGAHYNPAVTLGVIVRGNHNIDIKTAVGYVCAQLLGSLAGGGLMKHFLDDMQSELDCSTVPCQSVGHPSPGAGVTDSGAVGIEVIATFLLVFVVLNVATTASQANNQFFGMAIGLTVTCMAVAIGGLSGGALNPAVGTGTNAVAKDSDEIWIYWVGPLLGGLLGGIVFRVTSAPTEWSDEDDADGTVDETGTLDSGAVSVELAA